MRFCFNYFVIECSWDYLYVYDGDLIYVLLVVVFSGFIVFERDGNEIVFEVVVILGYVLLYFFSDVVYNLIGFNIIYSFDMCLNNCLG